MKSRWHSACALARDALNRIYLLPCILYLPCSLASGQTEIPSAPAPLVPSLALDMPSEPKQGQPAVCLSATTNSSFGLSLLPRTDNPLESQIEHEGKEAAEKSPLPLPDKPMKAATPASAPGSLLFPRAEWKWVELPVRPEDVVKPPAPPRNAEMVPFQSNREMDPDRMALVERLRGAGLLEPPRPQYDSEFERAVARSFRPEIIHIGHAQFSCSLITAIARKNPFCLLDPSFLGISF